MEDKMTQQEALKFIKDHKPEFEALRKKQKYLGTSFDIQLPPISESIVMANKCYGYEYCEEIPRKMIWCQFPYREQSRAHNTIKRLFEMECGDTEYISDPMCAYLFCVNLWGNHWAPSNKWVVAGCMSVSPLHVIDWIWIHPYFRNKGLTKMFLASYATHGGPLLIQPPVSTDMSRCLKSVHNIIMGDPQIAERYFAVMRGYLSNYTEMNLAPLNDSDIQKLMHGLTTLTASNTCKAIEIDREQTKKMAQCFAMTLMEMKKNPHIEKELRAVVEEYGIEKFSKESEEQIKHMINYGSSMKFNPPVSVE